MFLFKKKKHKENNLNCCDQELKTCEHLKILEKYLRDKNIPIEYEGVWWGGSSQTYSIYFDCYLDEKSLRRKFKLGKEVVYYEYDGRAAGQEAGFMCSICKCCIAGNHKLYSENKIIVK